MTTPEGMKRTELYDRILKERDAGRIVFWGLPDELMAAKLDDFIKQPADGILYDLNRGEEVVITFLEDPKWVNDFAVATVIRRLVSDKAAAVTRAERLEKALRGTLGLIRAAQDELSLCIQPDGDQDKAINNLLGLLDGPEQREIEGVARAALAGGDKG